ncbi:hypothetical protein UFOVP1229_130 [uncultured Caudovirales phage]|uniref:Uncharacterized protein n=1 Tax=uncultured Caudovirales phage TaxID=2100421 RepID=A0A6J5RDK8_9CAUD|nr:hypothetical protein UFOVP1229_130 [uncultured Caudovirales phage]
MDIDRLLSDDPIYATTNANSSEVFSMENMRAAYQKMKDMKPIPVVADGKEIGEVTEIVVSDRSLLASMKLQNLGFDKPVRFTPFSIPIRVDTSIPETWVPPESGSPHFSYGPEDESWMRPLGLGKLVPTMVLINNSVYDQLLASFRIPESIYVGEPSYSSYLPMLDRRFSWSY